MGSGPPPIFWGAPPNLFLAPPQLSVRNCFVRGSVVRYVQLPADEVDAQLLQDAARKEALTQKQ
uniref:U6 snRNA-associated Sm-like protein LSm2 n=1 Tax=Anas zonorhyncha TaxID=75864 RepID=A0A8B9UXB0_9AVES